MIDQNGFPEEEEFVEWLDLHASEVMRLMSIYFAQQAEKYKGWLHEVYYNSLLADSNMMYLALRGLEEM